MSKEVSYRCGMSDRCEFGCSLLKSDSKCIKYADRRECDKSMKQRSRVSKRMRIRNSKESELYKQMKNH